jgi:hypothetical protein
MCCLVRYPPPYIEDDQSSLDLKNKKAAIYGAEVKNSTYFFDKLIVNWWWQIR